MVVVTVLRLLASLGSAFAAIKSDGSVVTWGAEDFGGNSLSIAGQLGEGVVQVVAGASAFAAIKSDGSVVTWGAEDFGGNSLSIAGQLGEGTKPAVVTVRRLLASLRKTLFK
eukprot:TRINITY_DN11471_c0_g1_i2.p1 TRINITY_DN11471_c0_g1~~TRINITY_DN11471_c0_g1_i2.p1  ORF type:complete len:112 (-),score=19.10 TRINITY_DN11471_c0_g1_i2:71-406(-)